MEFGGPLFVFLAIGIIFSLLTAGPAGILIGIMIGMGLWIIYLILRFLVKL